MLLEAALARLSRSGDKPPVPAHCNPLSKGQSGGHEVQTVPSQHLGLLLSQAESPSSQSVIACLSSTECLVCMDRA